MNADLIHDLTEFLCGACSCQVKEQNPGFDLLLSTNWAEALFGEDSDGPPPGAAIGNGQKKEPELVVAQLGIAEFAGSVNDLFVFVCDLGLLCFRGACSGHGCQSCCAVVD